MQTKLVSDNYSKTVRCPRSRFPLNFISNWFMSKVGIIGIFVLVIDIIFKPFTNSNLYENLLCWQLFATYPHYNIDIFVYFEKN